MKKGLVIVLLGVILIITGCYASACLPVVTDNGEWDIIITETCFPEYYPTPLVF